MNDLSMIAVLFVAALLLWLVFRRPRNEVDPRDGACIWCRAKTGERHKHGCRRGGDW